MQDYPSDSRNVQALVCNNGAYAWNTQMQPVMFEDAANPCPPSETATLTLILIRTLLGPQASTTNLLGSVQATATNSESMSSNVQSAWQYDSLLEGKVPGSWRGDRFSLAAQNFSAPYADGPIPCVALSIPLSRKAPIRQLL